MNGLDVLYTPRPEGWEDFKIRCCSGFWIYSSSDCAWLPHSNQTKPLLLQDSFWMSVSIRGFHPNCACELASPKRTDKAVFKRREPCFAQWLKSPWRSEPNPSIRRALFILRNELGKSFELGEIVSGIENAKPCAKFGEWYGSCPSKMTFTESTGVSCKA